MSGGEVLMVLWILAGIVAVCFPPIGIVLLMLFPPIGIVLLVALIASVIW